MINGLPYAVFAAAMSLLSLGLCLRSRRAKWWPLAVLACPVFMLGLVSGIRERKSVYLASFVVLLAGALTMEYYIFQYNREKNRYAHLPPIVREMIKLNEEVRQTTIALYEASKKLERLGMVQSRISDIRNALAHIRGLYLLLEANQAAIERLTGFIADHADYIRRKHLEWAFLIETFYTDPLIARHSTQRKRYLSAFEDLLQYVHDNFEKIRDDKNPQHLANYDAWYLRYRGVADRLNQANRKRVQYQNAFVAANPAVSPFLPGVHHMAPFKFWDQFNF